MHSPTQLKSRSTSRGFTALEIVVAVVLLLIIAAVAIPNFLDTTAHHTRVPRIKADLRSLATGLEAYYVDNNCYPAWTSLTGSNPWTGEDGLGHANAFAGREAGAASIHSFRIRTASPDDPENGAANQFHLLTTPISYISSLMPDPYADSKGAAYGYYSTRTGYIIYSFGIDRDEAPNELGYIGDIDHALEATDLLHVVSGEPESVYNSNASQPSITLLCGPHAEWSNARGTGAFTYDPSNGTISEGDVWRVKN